MTQDMSHQWPISVVRARSVARAIGLRLALILVGCAAVAALLFLDESLTRRTLMAAWGISLVWTYLAAAWLLERARLRPMRRRLEMSTVVSYLGGRATARSLPLSWAPGPRRRAYLLIQPSDGLVWVANTKTGVVSALVPGKDDGIRIEEWAGRAWRLRLAYRNEEFDAPSFGAVKKAEPATESPN